MPHSDSVVQPSAPKRVARSPITRFTAATVVIGLAVGAIATSGGGDAGAATPVRAQSVGRFLDGSAGGMALQSLVDLKDARAKAAPNTSKRQGVNAELFDAGTVPIGNGLKLPGGGVFDLGAANQIAVAKTNGYSYGASGAVENNGGIQLTDKNGQYPSGATINLSGAALGSVAIPGLPTTIPGLPTNTGLPVPSAAALGGVVAKVGAVQALAQTGAGGKSVKPQSSVADLQLAIASPALGALLTQLDDAFQTDVIGGLTSLNPTLGAALKTVGFTGCSLTAPTSRTIKLEGGGVIIDPATATITIDLRILLKRLAGINIAHLSTSNFDLIKFLVQKLPSILSTGLEKIVNGITGSLESQFSACTTALTKALGTLITPLPAAINPATILKMLQGQIEKGIDSVSSGLISASGGGLATLANGLTGAVDIGLNVQSGPKIQPHNTQYKYTSRLAKTPDQATSVVKHQSLVRAIEIDLLDAAGSAGTGSGLPTTLPTALPSLPATNAVASHQLAGAHHAAAAGGAAVSLAMGNAAAGPSAAAPTVTRTTATPTTATGTGTNIPTGVPAGAAGHSDSGSPLLPVGLLLLGLVIAGGGVLSVRTRTRGKFSR